MHQNIQIIRQLKEKKNSVIPSINQENNFVVEQQKKLIAAHPKKPQLSNLQKQLVLQTVVPIIHNMEPKIELEEKVQHTDEDLLVDPKIVSLNLILEPSSLGRQPSFQTPLLHLRSFSRQTVPFSVPITFKELEKNISNIESRAFAQSNVPELHFKPIYQFNTISPLQALYPPGATVAPLDIWKDWKQQNFPQYEIQNLSAALPAIPPKKSKINLNLKNKISSYGGLNSNEVSREKLILPFIVDKSFEINGLNFTDPNYQSLTTISRNDDKALASKLESRPLSQINIFPIITTVIPTLFSNLETVKPNPVIRKISTIEAFKKAEKSLSNNYTVTFTQTPNLNSENTNNFEKELKFITREQIQVVEIPILKNKTVSQLNQQSTRTLQNFKNTTRKKIKVNEGLSNIQQQINNASSKEILQASLYKNPISKSSSNYSKDKLFVLSTYTQSGYT